MEAQEREKAIDILHRMFQENEEKLRVCLATRQEYLLSSELIDPMSTRPLPQENELLREWLNVVEILYRHLKIHLPETAPVLEQVRGILLKYKRLP